jgi:hypothetical protein
MPRSDEGNWRRCGGYALSGTDRGVAVDTTTALFTPFLTACGPFTRQPIQPKVAGWARERERR